MDGQKLIGADAETPVAELFGDRVQVLNVFLQAIEEDKIVSCPVHFGKLEFHNLEP
jgi:hypothetical protein